MSPLFVVRDLLRNPGGYSVEDLVAHSGLTPTLVSAALAHWQARGRVRRCLPLASATASCAPAGCGHGGCRGCATRPMAPVGDRYQWREPAPD